jgi:vitamin B12 transporter
MKKQFLVMTAIIMSSHLHAQDTTTTKQLDDVIVTATKFKQKQNTTGKVVTIIDKATLERNAGKTVSEVLNLQAGIFINGANNNAGANQELYFRGSNVGNTLILIDGIPVSDPSQINNSFDLNNMALNQIESIEILKGAQSTLWGSDAIAGVINIITKKTSPKKINTTTLLSYGSYNTAKVDIGINGAIKKLYYNIGYNLTNSKGFSAAFDSTGVANFDKDKFLKHNIQANLGYEISNRFSIKGLYNFAAYKASIDAGAFTDDADNVFDNKNALGNIELSYKTAKLQLHLSKSNISSKRIYTDDSLSIGGFATYSKGNYNGTSNITELFGNYSITKNLSLVSGIQYNNQKTDQSYFSISAYGPYKSELGDTARVNNFSFYNSLQLVNTHRFNMEAGFRYNKHSIYGSNLTYTFNPSYNIDENTKLFVNISSAYKIPSLYQLYSEYGNKNLKPEESINYEIGVQSAYNKSNSLRIVGFKRDIKSIIIFYTEPITFQSTYLNKTAQYDYGFELESSIAFGKKGKWQNNFTYVDGDGVDDNIKVKNLYRRPNFAMNSSLIIEPIKNLTLMPTFRLIGARLKGEFDAGPNVLPHYYTLNFYARYTYNKNYSAYVDLNNITNQTYFDAVGYNSRRFNLMTGIQFTF